MLQDTQTNAPARKSPAGAFLSHHSVSQTNLLLFLKCKDVSECLNSSACLTEVSHLLVDTQFDVRNTCIVQSFLQVRILHLLRITELLHEQYQTLSAALLNHVSYELTTTVLVGFRIVQKYFVKGVMIGSVKE